MTLWPCSLAKPKQIAYTEEEKVLSRRDLAASMQPHLPRGAPPAPPPQVQGPPIWRLGGHAPTDSPAPSPTSPRLAHVAYQWPRGAGLPAQSIFPPHKNPSVSTMIASFSNTRAQSWLNKRDREALLTSGAPDPLPGLLPCPCLHPHLLICVPHPICARCLSLSVPGSIFVSSPGRLSAAEASQKQRC